MERLATATIRLLRGLQYTIAHETASARRRPCWLWRFCSASSSHPARLGT